MRGACLAALNAFCAAVMASRAARPNPARATHSRSAKRAVPSPCDGLPRGLACAGPRVPHEPLAAAAWLHPVSAWISVSTNRRADARAASRLNHHRPCTDVRVGSRHRQAATGGGPSRTGPQVGPQSRPPSRPLSRPAMQRPASRATESVRLRGHRQGAARHGLEGRHGDRGGRRIVIVVVVIAALAP